MSSIPGDLSQRGLCLEKFQRARADLANGSPTAWAPAAGELITLFSIAIDFLETPRTTRPDVRYLCLIDDQQSFVLPYDPNDIFDSAAISPSWTLTGIEQLAAWLDDSLARVGTALSARGEVVNHDPDATYVVAATETLNAWRHDWLASDARAQLVASGVEHAADELYQARSWLQTYHSESATYRLLGILSDLIGRRVSEDLTLGQLLAPDRLAWLHDLQHTVQGIGPNGEEDLLVNELYDWFKSAEITIPEQAAERNLDPLKVADALESLLVRRDRIMTSVAAEKATDSAAQAASAQQAAGEAAGAVATSELASEIGDFGNKRRNSASIWFLGVVVVLAGLVIAIIVWHQKSSDASWQSAATALAVSLPVLGLATFMAREAGRARQAEIRAAYTATQLKSIKAYAQLLDEGERQQLLLEFGREVFRPLEETARPNQLDAIPLELLRAIEALAARASR